MHGSSPQRRVFPDPSQINLITKIKGLAYRVNAPFRRPRRNDPEGADYYLGRVALRSRRPPKLNKKANEAAKIEAIADAEDGPHARSAADVSGVPAE